MAKDLYEILGVSKTSTDVEIKKAYRKKAMDLHPDKHKGDKEIENKFKEINQAYEILSDKQKREQYDRFGSAGGSGGGSDFGGGFSGNGFNFNGFQGDFSGSQGFADIFEAFFTGFGPRAKGPRKGRDLEFQLKIDFTEAVFGVEKELIVTRMKDPSSQNSERLNERIKVKIPAGVDNDSVIRLSEKGEPGTMGGPAGDLYVHIRTSNHPEYIRNGYDIHSQQKINLLQAVLGDQIEVKTLHGNVTLKIPAGTQPDKVFKLKSYGVQRINHTDKGDQYIKIIVEVPTKLSKKEKILYQDLAKESGFQSKNKGGFW